MQSEDLLVLVNEQDEEIGTMPKLEAHEKGLLHRAFSVLLFNEKKQMLIHQRADSKYHSAGLWTNACCSHPLVGETLENAVNRRLKEELGIVCPVHFAYKFIYKTSLENELIEHELDHVFIGEFSGELKPDPNEVKDYRWISLNDLRNEILERPDQFTFWFKKIINEHLKSFHFPTQNHPF